jgi:hypothetical protein
MDAVALAQRPAAGRAARQRRRPGRPARALLVAASVLVGLLCGVGWTYFLRGLGWLNAGPPVSDSLPLLALADHAVQPLERVVVAWLFSGAVCGLALRAVRRSKRLLLTGVPALVLLLLQSQAAYALTRNLSFASVVFGRMPGPGPWLEAGLFAGATVLAPAVGYDR